MKIDTSFLSEPLHSSLPKINNDNKVVGVNDESFKNIFSQMMEASQEASAYSKEKTAELLTGNLEDMPEMMVAGEKSGILFQLNLTTKNKVLDAYNEIMRTQI